jgi:hypothetical protein
MTGYRLSERRRGPVVALSFFFLSFRFTSVSLNVTLELLAGLFRTLEVPNSNQGSATCQTAIFFKDFLTSSSKMMRQAKTGSFC